jgi:predicted dehydrogenase
MSTTKNLRWGVIGLGWFGEVHADALSVMPGVELAAFCTRRRERLDELGRRFAVAKRYTDYRQLLADPEVARRPGQRQARAAGEAHGGHGVRV